ncbi:MAG: hypothetical protein HZA17_01250 [Nitrospirae bacterium]|nr:hypothetical protein [Nitrospirota bacterium]
MKTKYYGIGLFLVFLVSLAGCGGDTGGAPGSTGGSDSGLQVLSVSVATSSPDFDANIFICPSGEPEPGLFREDATLTVELAALAPNPLNWAVPAQLEECQVTYLKANQDPAAPIIENFTIYPNCRLTVGPNACPITIMDIERKVKYYDDFLNLNGPVEYPTHYIAKLNCRFVSKYGQSAYFQVEHDIWLADFNKCS